jgi:hypothetical protein
MALIVASVPELTMRTLSTDGSIAQIFSAIRVSSTQGAPKLRPRLAVAMTASITSGCAWPRIMGPHEPT